MINLHARAQRNFFRLTFEQQLEHLCNKWEVSPLGRYKHPGGTIYVAEGWQAKRPEDGTPGWTVLWAVRRKGACIAQPLYLITAATPAQRLLAALSCAVTFLDEADGEKKASSARRH